MTAAAIEVRGLSKYYALGQTLQGTQTFREALTDVATRPFRRHARHDEDAADAEATRPPRAHLWALKDVSFDLAPGEVLGVIGRNGAGKSTLLKIMARITDPTEGQVVIRGRVGSLLEVGTGFHSELTGRENVYLSGAILGMRRSEIDRKLDEIVAFAEVEKFLDTPIKRYSSGMGLRLAFAVAAHLEPEVLLVDEVLAVGDASFQKRCLGKMSEVAAEGRTVLLVSHNMAAIENLCHRSIVLHHGELTYMGPPSEGIRRYLAAVLPEQEGDLSSRDDRRGSGRARITAVHLHDEHGAPMPVLQCGAATVFEIEYEAEQDRPIRNPIFELKFTDQIGNRLFTVSTYLAGIHLPEVPSAGSVFCEVPQVLLPPGEYTYDAYLISNDELCDEVERAGEVTVVESDVFGSGKVPKKMLYGQFVMPHRWHDRHPADG